MTRNNKLFARLEQLSARIRQSVEELIERRNALFAELVAEGEVVQSKLNDELEARRREIDARIDTLKQRTQVVEKLRKRVEAAADEARDRASQRFSQLQDRVSVVRSRAEDVAEDVRDGVSNPVQWLYGQLNLATSSDLEQVKRQINALRIRVTALKAA